MQRGYQGAYNLYSSCEDLLSPKINYTPSNSEVLIIETPYQTRYKAKHLRILQQECKALTSLWYKLRAGIHELRTSTWKYQLGSNDQRDNKQERIQRLTGRRNPNPSLVSRYSPHRRHACRGLGSPAVNTTDPTLGSS